MASLNDLLIQYFQESATQAIIPSTLEPDQLNQLSILIKDGVENLLIANVTLQDIENAQKQLIAEIIPHFKSNDLSGAQATNSPVPHPSAPVAAVPTHSNPSDSEPSCPWWPFCFRS
jgi:septum formation inhibitor MinC